jgi:hypothetical protein
MQQFNQFFNGQGTSKHIQTAFDSIVNGDVHSDIGSITSQVALVADTTSGVPTEDCMQCTSPAGTTYFFSFTSGKIWKRAVNGSYSSLTDNANTTGHRGCRYYNGYIRYWTATKLGKFVVETEASRNDSHGTFSNGQALGSCEENLTLYITDGKYIASVNSSETFSANALDLPAQYIGSCIIPDGFTNVLIGTFIGLNVQTCRAFLWDTYSDSFTLSDEIPESGVNSFINCDEIILAQCGNSGKIYQWTGQTMALWNNELRGESTIHGQLRSTVFKSKPLIAVGNSIYSIYRKNAEMPRVLVKEYTSSASITSIGFSGGTLIVSTDEGVDLSGTDKATATIDTPEIHGRYNQVVIDYTSLPTGTAIGISTNINGAGWVAQTPITDTINKKVYFDGGLADCSFMQARITLTPSGSNSPVITNITIQSNEKSNLEINSRRNGWTRNIRTETNRRIGLY